MNEHTILIAFTVFGETREQANQSLMSQLPDATADQVIISSWWVAEDDRRDGSDCDSAVFVHPGLQHEASHLLYRLNMTNPCNLIAAERNANGFEGTQA